MAQKYISKNRIGGQLWYKVRSSNVDELSYDSKRKLMSVKFRNGRLYVVYGVSPTQWQNILRVKSKGKWYWKHIRRQAKVVIRVR